MALAAAVSALAALLAPEARIEELSPREKAAIVVISGLPAPPGVGGVIVRRWDRHLPRPPRALVFADQEGGPVRAFPDLAPSVPASSYRSVADAFAAGKEAGAAMDGVGVDVDLAPVLDAPDGPLGSRHFRSASLGVAFGRGLLEGGAGACAKHFPGLGTAAVSTDVRPRVPARLTQAELDAFRAAVRAGLPCVMVGHAFYPALGRLRASLEPKTYELLRSLGFDGLAITDSMNIVSSPPAYWPTKAISAGADLLLYTNARHARRAIETLVPLARRGALDEKVVRVLRYRRSLGVPAPSP